jgi:hypothetical protein
MANLTFTDGALVKALAPGLAVAAAAGGRSLGHAGRLAAAESISRSYSAACCGSRSSLPISSSGILDGRPTAALARFLKPFPVEWERQRKRFTPSGA